MKRLLVVGGAGSLLVAPGVQTVDTPEFASHVAPGILAGISVTGLAVAIDDEIETPRHVRARFTVAAA
jgi:hypothetical protein